MYPEFPLKVTFFEENDELLFDNEEEVACHLEWFDSDDPEENAIVVDKLGRRVKLKVEKLEILLIELEE